MKRTDNNLVGEKQVQTGLIYRVEQLKDVLRDCLEFDKKIRATMWGEGETSDDNKARPISNSVDSMVYDALSMATTLRGELETVWERVDGKPDMKKVSHG